MYISKDDDYVPTFESPWIHLGWTPAIIQRLGGPGPPLHPLGRGVDLEIGHAYVV